MADTTGQGQPASPFNRWWFRFTGKLACWWYDRMDMFPTLVAQAAFETGDFTSGIFLNGKNAFGLRAPTAYAEGTVPGVEGDFASFPSYWTCWKSRLEWDQRHGTDGLYKNGETYIRALGVHNYYTGDQDAYVAGVRAKYAELSWMTKVWGRTFDGDGGWIHAKLDQVFGGAAKYIKRALVISLWLALVLVVLWILWKVYKMLRKR